MRFDVNLHDKCPKGFVIGSATKATKTSLWTQTRYDPLQPSFEVYGLKADILHATLDTHYTQRFFGKTIKEQAAFLSLSFDTGYSGFEKKPEHEEEETTGSSQDPEKIRVKSEIFKGLATKLNESGYSCKAGGMFLQIKVPENTTDPLKDIAEIFKKLKNIEAAYERGDKPLGDIKEAAGTVKINHYDPSPKNLAGATRGTKSKEESPEQWQEFLKTRATRDIMALTKKYFPKDRAVTAEQYDLFEDALKDLLAKSK